MAELHSIKPYETETMNNVTGTTLRPGGIELTMRSLEFCEFPPDSILLDIGCGNGTTVKFLRECGFQAYGLDRSLKLLTGPTNTTVRFLADGQLVPFPSGSLNGIIMECSLSVMKDPGKVLEEIYRLLAPGGLMILSDMYARNPSGIGPLKTALSGGCFTSLWSQHEIISLIRSKKIKEVLWEDHSEAIRSMMGKIMFEYGSMNNFWCCLFDQNAKPTGNSLNFQLLLSRARVGYFLMVVQKPVNK